MSPQRRAGQNPTEAITLGAQTSADDDRTMEHVIAFRTLLAQHSKRSYSNDIVEFALILRIGGAMQEFGEGCERLRRNRRAKYISVDLGFPSTRWKGATNHAIRRFLVDIVEAGLHRCIERLESDKVRVDATALFRDFKKAKLAFVGVPTQDA